MKFSPGLILKEHILWPTRGCWIPITREKLPIFQNPMNYFRFSRSHIFFFFIPSSILILAWSPLLNNRGENIYLVSYEGYISAGLFWILLVCDTRVPSYSYRPRNLYNNSHDQNLISV